MNIDIYNNFIQSKNHFTKCNNDEVYALMQTVKYLAICQLSHRQSIFPQTVNFPPNS